jgi:hypothetical protein
MKTLFSKTTISKDDFWVAYNSFPPNKFIKFCYKYFSRETEQKDLKVKRSIVAVLLSLFGVGFIATIFNLPRPLIGAVTISYGIILSVLVLSLFAAVFMNNARIGKIRKALGGISKEYYNQLAEMYYESV